MESVHQLVESCDIFRSRLMRGIFQSKFLRRIYADAPMHLRTGAIISITISLILIFVCPEILFYGGPLILGVPHLAVSFRYSIGPSASIGKIQRTALFGFLIGILALIQNTTHWMPAEYFLPLELFLGFTFLMTDRGSFKVNFLIATGAALLGFVLGQNYLFWLFLLFFHNVFAFYVWYSHTKKENVRKEILLVFGIMTTVTGILFSMDLANPTFERLSAFLFQGQINGNFAQKCVVVFLLWQAMHYWIWMKGIPDSCSPRGIPIPFKVRLQHWQNWIRPMGIMFVFLSIACLLVIAAKFGLEDARSIYIPFASFHGIFEIIAFFTLRNFTGKT